MGRALVVALIAGRADGLAGFELDELLQDERHGLAHDVDAAARADGL